MTTTDPTRLPGSVLPGSVVRGESAEDPTVAIPVVPRQYRPAAPAHAYPPPPHAGAPTAPTAPMAPLPVLDPYGPPAGLGCPPPPGYRGAQRGPRRAGLVVAGVLGGVLASVLVVGLVAGGSPVVAPATFDVGGTLSLPARSSQIGSFTGSSTEGAACEGAGGYSDISAGRAVTVYDPEGTLVGAGVLSRGTVSYPSCTFAFTVTGVPAGSTLYEVEISHRGRIPFTQDEAAAGLSLSLGD